MIRHGSCSGATDWKIKAKPDDGRIEVESEIDSNRNGQTWTWTLRHDGSVAAQGRSTTTGRSGSFEVERKTRQRRRHRRVQVPRGQPCDRRGLRRPRQALTVRPARCGAPVFGLVSEKA